MVKHRRKASFQLWIEPEVHQLRDTLPGNIRQRVKHEMEALSDQPRPDYSRALDVTGLEIPVGIEIRRIRLEHWRIIYAINDGKNWVWVLAIRQRPPYQYEDLPEITQKISEE